MHQKVGPGKYTAWLPTQWWSSMRPQGSAKVIPPVGFAGPLDPNPAVCTVRVLYSKQHPVLEIMDALHVLERNALRVCRTDPGPPAWRLTKLSRLFGHMAFNGVPHQSPLELAAPCTHGPNAPPRPGQSPKDCCTQGDVCKTHNRRKQSHRAGQQEETGIPSGSTHRKLNRRGGTHT